MQCTQPFCGTSAGYTGLPWQYGHSCSCNYDIRINNGTTNIYLITPRHRTNTNAHSLHESFPSISQPPVYPEIIGEGEIASVTFPDGSVHLYFIPNKHSSPTYSPYSNNTVGAYYVRRIYPWQFPLFNQQGQKIPGGLYSQSCYVPSNPVLQDFQLKFHNDGWTSTTDLQYFFPRNRRADWLPLTRPTRCASVQIDIPVKDTRQQEPPCLCSQNKQQVQKNEFTCECHRLKHTCSINTIREHKQDKFKNMKICDCSNTKAMDAAVATVADEACSCDVGNERNTQTGSDRHINDVEIELWTPKTNVKRKLYTNYSEKDLDLHKTRTSTTCSCSDTDDYNMTYK